MSQSVVTIWERCWATEGRAGSPSTAIFVKKTTNENLPNLLQVLDHDVTDAGVAAAPHNKLPEESDVTTDLLYDWEDDEADDDDDDEMNIYAPMINIDTYRKKNFVLLIARFFLPLVQLSQSQIYWHGHLQPM